MAAGTNEFMSCAGCTIVQVYNTRVNNFFRFNYGHMIIMLIVIDLFELVYDTENSRFAGLVSNDDSNYQTHNQSHF